MRLFAFAKPFVNRQSLLSPRPSFSRLRKPCPCLVQSLLSRHHFDHTLIGARAFSNDVETSERPAKPGEQHLTAALLAKIIRGVVRSIGSADRDFQRALNGLTNSNLSPRSLRDWHNLLTHGPISARDDSSQVACLALAVAFMLHQSRSVQQISMADLDFVWELIRDALHSSIMLSGLVSASRSAQGFLAIPLCSILVDGDIEILFRLHVWLPDGQRSEHGYGIHSHQPFAQSWVLTGEGKDCAYTVEPVSGDASATHSKYALGWSSGDGLSSKYKARQTHSRVVNTGNHVDARPGRIAVHHRGMSYRIPAGAFHSSEVAPNSIHATLFLFDASQGFVRDAPVLGPKKALSYTQIRDTAGVSVAELAKLVDITRKGEQHLIRARKHLQGRRWQEAVAELDHASGVVPKSLQSVSFQESVLDEFRLVLETHTSNDPVQIAEWRYFYGRALFLAGQKQQGLEQFNWSGSMTPSIAFCKEPSEQRRAYLRDLARYGADFERVDHHGCSALDYAIMSSDFVAEEIVLDALRRCTLEQNEWRIHERVREANVRKLFRDVISTVIRPVLTSSTERLLVDVRRAYSTALRDDSAKARAFDSLHYVKFDDLIRFGSFPRSSNGLTRVYNPVEDADLFLIFISYRWLNPDPWATTPDDDESTQYKRTLQAIEQFLREHPSVRRERLGIWIDFACINQDFPLAGIAALPLSLAQCDAIISMVDDRYYSRAWCSVETRMIQALQRSYGLHLWYEYVDVQSAAGHPVGILRPGLVDGKVSLRQKVLRFEEDWPKILFLEQQSRLLTS